MTPLEAPTPKPNRNPLARMPADLSPTGKLVYLYLAERGAATIDDLKATLDVPQIRLYPVLASLEQEELVDRSGQEFALRT